MTTAFVFFVLLMGLGSSSCENIDQGLTAPAAPDQNNISTKPTSVASDAKDLELPIEAVKAEFRKHHEEKDLRHHHDHDHENGISDHSTTHTPSHQNTNSFPAHSDPWQPSQANGFNANHFPTYSQPTNTFSPQFKTGISSYFDPGFEIQATGGQLLNAALTFSLGLFALSVIVPFVGNVIGAGIFLKLELLKYIRGIVQGFLNERSIEDIVNLLERKDVERYTEIAARAFKLYTDMNEANKSEE